VIAIFQYQQDLPANKGYVMTPITPYSRKYKKEDAMLRPQHESTLEKQQRLRLERRAAIANKLKDLDKEVL
jgi:hypothetical protein